MGLLFNLLFSFIDSTETPNLIAISDNTSPFWILYDKNSLLFSTMVPFIGFSKNNYVVLKK